MTKQNILATFVQCFSEDFSKPYHPGELVTERKTHASSLEHIYDAIQARFPKLFEELLLSYRWYGADTESFRLFPNPPGNDLSEFLANMQRDKTIFEITKQNGFVLIGSGPDANYDALCFDIRKKTVGRKYPIVKLDHEELLCNSRIKIVDHLAKSFDELVEKVVLSRSSK